MEFPKRQECRVCLHEEFSALRKQKPSPCPPIKISGSVTSQCNSDILLACYAKGVDSLAEKIISYLDVKSLDACEKVSKQWQRIVVRSSIYKKTLERNVRKNCLWRVIVERRDWMNYLFHPMKIPCFLRHALHKKMFNVISKDLQELQSRWTKHKYTVRVYNRCQDVACMEADEKILVAGFVDGAIRIYNEMKVLVLEMMDCHAGEVRCLQFHETRIFSGSVDCTVRIWDIKTGRNVGILKKHSRAVNDLKLKGNMLISCSSDNTIIVWSLLSDDRQQVGQVLMGHTADVLCVDLDTDFVLSGSADTTIKVWPITNQLTIPCVRTLAGHTDCVTSLQYDGRMIVSGSLDTTIRLWDMNTGHCYRVIQAHKVGVKKVRFNLTHISSCGVDGTFHMWNLKNILLPCSKVELFDKMSPAPKIIFYHMDDFYVICYRSDGTFVAYYYLTFIQPKYAFRLYDFYALVECCYHCCTVSHRESHVHCFSPPKT